MNPQTDRAIRDLRRLLPSMAQIHQPAIENAITALLRGSEALQVAEQRNEMLQQRAREQVSA